MKFLRFINRLNLFMWRFSSYCCKTKFQSKVKRRKNNKKVKRSKNNKKQINWFTGKSFKILYCPTQTFLARVVSTGKFNKKEIKTWLWDSTCNKRNQFLRVFQWTKSSRSNHNTSSPQCSRSPKTNLPKSLFNGPNVALAVTFSPRTLARTVIALRQWMSCASSTFPKNISKSPLKILKYPTRNWHSNGFITTRTGCKL